jgi:hypothetical protein
MLIALSGLAATASQAQALRPLPPEFIPTQASILDRR